MLQRKRGQILGTLAAVAAASVAVSGCVGGGRSAAERADAARIGVNSFLWRASLDTLNFMPLAQVDPLGGTIITDWYADPVVPNERFKAQVYILDTRLRADGLQVSVFKQVKNGEVWVDALTDDATALQIENAILRRARELKISTIED